MGDGGRIRTRHAELTLEEIAEALPGTGEIMASVGRCYASCWHAAHGGNWDLATYFLGRVRSLQRGLAVIRPKYKNQLAAFEHEALAPLFTTLEARDLAAFDRAFDRGVERANHYHTETGEPHIRWKLPERGRDDLDLGPA